MAGNALQSILETGRPQIFIGRPGAEAIAGVAMSGTIIMALMTVVIGLVTANTAFVSRRYNTVSISLP